MRRTTTCVPVLDVVLEHFLERHDLRHELAGVRIGHERQHDHAERRLHRRVLVQLVEHDARNCVALELDDDAHAVLVGLVAQSRRCLRASCRCTSSAMSVTSFALLTWYGSSVTTICDLFEDSFSSITARARITMRAAARLLIILDAGAAVDVAAGREVGTLDQSF